MTNEVVATVASLRRSQDALDAWLAGLAALDVGAPSRLADWTIGHVLAHLSRNAEAHVRMASGLPQYPHGAAGRLADIESGAVRPWNAQLADVAVSGASAADAYDAEVDWDGSAITLGGPRPMAVMPLLRQREIEIHRVDLGLGYEFADLPADYLRRDLAMMQMQWQARQPIGLTTLPAAALALPDPDRLAWLMGRAEFDNLPPAEVF